jgi:hypothetical protein
METRKIETVPVEIMFTVAEGISMRKRSAVNKICIDFGLVEDRLQFKTIYGNPAAWVAELKCSLDRALKTDEYTLTAVKFTRGEAL